MPSVASLASCGATSGWKFGIELSSGTIIAFTDDDCRVARDWPRAFALVSTAKSSGWSSAAGNLTRPRLQIRMRVIRESPQHRECRALLEPAVVNP